MCGGVQERVLQLGRLQALDLVACLHKRLLPTPVWLYLLSLPACLPLHCCRRVPPGDEVSPD
jgi:hypothetical protein